MSDPARNYSVIPPRPKPSIEEFRAFVSSRLTAAMEAIPETVPFGMMDEVAQPLQDSLQEIEDYLYELDVEERRQEDREESRERKVAAKRRDATVEELATQIDHWVQKAVEALGISRAKFLDGIIIDGLLRWVVRLIDKFDPAALEAQHIYSRGGTDPRIAAIVDVLRTQPAGLRTPVTSEPDSPRSQGRE